MAANKDLTPELVIQALNASKGNRRAAAIALGCHRNMIGYYIANFQAVKEAAAEFDLILVDTAEVTLHNFVYTAAELSKKALAYAQGKEDGKGNKIAMTKTDLDLLEAIKPMLMLALRTKAGYGLATMPETPFDALNTDADEERMLVEKFGKRSDRVPPVQH